MTVEADILSAMIEAFGSKDPNFIDVLEAEGAFAEMYRERRDRWQTEIPEPEIFDMRFRAAMSVQAGNDPKANARSHTITSIATALKASGIDDVLDQGDQIEYDLVDRKGIEQEVGRVVALEMIVRAGGLAKGSFSKILDANLASEIVAAISKMTMNHLLTKHEHEEFVLGIDVEAACEDVFHLIATRNAEQEAAHVDVVARIFDLDVSEDHDIELPENHPLLILDADFQGIRRLATGVAKAAAKDGHDFDRTWLAVAGGLAAARTGCYAGRPYLAQAPAMIEMFEYGPMPMSTLHVAVVMEYSGMLAIPEGFLFAEALDMLPTIMIRNPSTLVGFGDDDKVIVEALECAYEEMEILGSQAFELPNVEDDLEMIRGRIAIMDAVELIAALHESEIITPPEGTKTYVPASIHVTTIGLSDASRTRITRAIDKAGARDGHDKTASGLAWNFEGTESISFKTIRMLTREIAKVAGVDHVIALVRDEFEVLALFDDGKEITFLRIDHEFDSMDADATRH